MKKLSIIIRLSLSIALIITSIVIWRKGGGVTTAYAVGDLTVNWGVPEGDPIFVVNNASPGDAELRTVIVTNNAGTSRPVGVRGLLDFETGGFSGILEVTIAADGSDVYGGTSGTGTKTLAQFFADSAGPEGLSLTTIGAGGTTNYDFTVLFPTLGGDDFQGASVQFDLRIGINVPVPEECQQITFAGDPIFGTDGNDRIYGTSGNDLIFGLEGNDRILSHGGDDCLVGGLGTDELRGETGNDFLFGNEGNDLIVGAVGNDLLLGGAGNDTIRGEWNEDVIFGEEGDDFITGGSGNDTIDAGSGNDRVRAEDGTDMVEGQDGDDTLEGGAGNDTLLGGPGFDRTYGQAGTDTCEGEIETYCEL